MFRFDWYQNGSKVHLCIYFKECLPESFEYELINGQQVSNLFDTQLISVVESERKQFICKWIPESV